MTAAPVHPSFYSYVAINGRNPHGAEVTAELLAARDAQREAGATWWRVTLVDGEAQPVLWVPYAAGAWLEGWRDQPAAEAEFVEIMPAAEVVKLDAAYIERSDESFGRACHPSGDAR